jgi:hypothetical protein
MQYAYILSLIDADLERLRMARQLLMASQTLSRKPVNKVVRSSVRTTKRLPEKRNGGVAAVVSGVKKQQPAKGRSKADMLAPEDHETTILTLDFGSPKDVPGFGAAVGPTVEQTIFQEEGQHRTPTAEEQTALGERAGTLLLQRKLEIRRLTPAKQPLALPRTALNNPAPARPVFIPAEQIRQEHMRKQEELKVETAGFSMAAAVPLTAELLTQRWIQGFAG